MQETGYQSILPPNLRLSQHTFGYSSVALPNLSINGNQPIEQLIPRSHSRQLISLTGVLAHNEQTINDLLAIHSPANDQFAFPAHSTKLSHFSNLGDWHREQNRFWLPALQLQVTLFGYIGRKVQHWGLFGGVNDNRPTLTFVPRVESDRSNWCPDSALSVQDAELIFGVARADYCTHMINRLFAFHPRCSGPAEEAKDSRSQGLFVRWFGRVGLL